MPAVRLSGLPLRPRGAGAAVLRLRLHRSPVLRWARRVPRRAWLAALVVIAAVLGPWLAALLVWYWLLPFRLLLGVEVVLPRVW